WAARSRAAGLAARELAQAFEPGLRAPGLDRIPREFNSGFDARRAPRDVQRETALQRERREMRTPILALEYLDQSGRVGGGISAREFHGGARRESERLRVDQSARDATARDVEGEERTHRRDFVP